MESRNGGAAMQRRGFLLTLAAGLAGAAAVHGMTGPRRPVPPARARRPALARPAPVLAAAGAVVTTPIDPPHGTVDRLPGDGQSIALTIDDGTNSAVVSAFARFALDSGVRLTFFPNGRYRSWEENLPVLGPLVESGQVALGNHTWSHPDLTTLADPQIADEIGRNRDWLRATFGVDTPFFRPPYGACDDRVAQIAADCGHPTVALWNGTLGDARVLTAEELMGYAQRWFQPQTIVVGHANHDTVTTRYAELLALITERGLQTVTLADVWARPIDRLRGARVGLPTPP